MQLLSQVFSVKMAYGQLITITLSIYKNFSLGRLSVVHFGISYHNNSKYAMVIFQFGNINKNRYYSLSLAE